MRFDSNAVCFVCTKQERGLRAPPQCWGWCISVGLGLLLLEEATVIESGWIWHNVDQV